MGGFLAKFMQCNFWGEEKLPVGRDFFISEMNSSLSLDDQNWLAAVPQALPALLPVALGTGAWALACPHSAVTSAFPDKLHIGEQKCKQFPSKTWHYNSFRRSQLLRCHTYTLVYSYKQWGTFTQSTQSAFKQIRSGCPLYRCHNSWNCAAFREWVCNYD